MEDRRTPTTEETIRLTVRCFMTEIGFDTSNPITIQKDIQHLRRSREICELIQNKMIALILVAIVSATIGAAWVGFTVAISDKSQAYQVGKK